jgi:hypothetical protein
MFTRIRHCLKIFTAINVHLLFYLFIYYLILTSRNPNQNSADYGIFLHQIKMRQPIGKKGFHTNRVLKKQEVEALLNEVGSELGSFFKYSQLKLKIKNC